MGNLSVGVDLGQASDPTAIAISEKVGPESHVRHLERLPLGTPYPHVCSRVSSIVASLPKCSLIVDGTGVGRAVVNMLQDAGLSPVVVSITSGNTVRREGQWIWMPKRKLIAPLITALEAGLFKVAAGLSDASALLNELTRFQVTRGDRGHLRMEGKGAHDDLIIAVALSLLELEKANQ